MTELKWIKDLVAPETSKDAGSRKQEEQWNQESELDSNTKTRKE